MAGYRRAKWRSVKRHYNLTVEEAATTLGVHKGTVRRWIKKGLPALTDRKPLLILGEDLIDWLKSQRKKPQKCAPCELYCMKCRGPRQAADAKAEFHHSSNGGGNLRARCSVCGTSMNRRIGAGQIDQFRQHLSIAITQADLDIKGCTDPSLKVHFARGSKTHAKAPS